jgi:hypothetical protein
VEAVGVGPFAVLTPFKLLISLVREVHFLHPLPGRMYEICTVAIRSGGGGKRTASTILRLPLYGGCTKKQPQQQNTTGQHFLLACVFFTYSFHITRVRFLWTRSKTLSGIRRVIRGLPYLVSSEPMAKTPGSFLNIALIVLYAKFHISATSFTL